MFFNRRSFLPLVVFVAARFSNISASVYFPYCGKSSSSSRAGCQVTNRFRRETTKLQRTQKMVARDLRMSSYPTTGAAMAIPGYGIAEQVFVGGAQNFLSIYNLVITARILLSWFPQAQGVAALQPVYAITDPYLNLFRGLIPPIFGLDFSPILAFFLLNVLTNATAALGAEVSPDMKKKLLEQRRSCASFAIMPCNPPPKGNKLSHSALPILNER